MNPMWPMVGIPALLFLFQSWWGNRPQGTPNDPLPFRGKKPRGPFVMPTESDFNPDTLYQGFKTFYAPDITPTQAAPLIAQAILANPNGKVIGNNFIRGAATPKWRGQWTMVPKGIYYKGEPQFIWIPIRSYASAKMGLLDWLQSLPETARAALEFGDFVEYAGAVGPMVGVDKDVYAVQLKEAADLWLSKLED